MEAIHADVTQTNTNRSSPPQAQSIFCPITTKKPSTACLKKHKGHVEELGTVPALLFPSSTSLLQNIHLSPVLYQLSTY